MTNAINAQVEKKKVAVILPARKNYPNEFMQQQLESIRFQFGTTKIVDYYVQSEVHSEYTRWIPHDTLKLLEKNTLMAYDEAIMFTESGITIELVARSHLRQYFVDWCGRITPANRPVDVDDCENINHHVFNELSPIDNWTYYYFPYGYLFRYNGLGPIDSFGFRITADLHALAKRPKNHKVIACFGGSSCWGLYSLHHQTFPSVLEKELNAYCKEQHLDLTFTVLNFGQNGAVVLNELMAYILYCDNIKPDIVVAHDAYNDFVFGLINDPRLLRDNHIAYQDNFERWSQILHNTVDKPCTQNERVATILNQPLPVVKAYATRKRQFCDFVRARGAKFVWGLQPLSHFKPQRNHFENLLHGHLSEGLKYFSAAIEQTPQLYKIFLDNFRCPSDVLLVNCCPELGQYGEESFIFADPVHLTQLGESIVGKLYANQIIDRLFQAKSWEI